jgi:hypothetical protein
MLFLDNKYTNCYYSIVRRAKSRLLLNDVYSERHHIVPRSLGGDNSDENLVTLTGREHFICHILLSKMTIGKAKYSMTHAAVGMKRSRSYQYRYINNRLYESIKKEYALISSERNRGKTASIETRAKMSLASKGKPKTKEHSQNISKGLKGKPKLPMPDVTKQKISSTSKGRPSHRKGKVGEFKHSKEAKQKISESNKRRIYSEETKAKISAGVKAAKERKRQLFLGS